MVEKYSQSSAQQGISPDASKCLQDEKHSKDGYETRVRDKLTEVDGTWNQHVPWRAKGRGRVGQGPG